MQNTKVKLIAGLLGLYLVAVGISYAVFSYVVKPAQKSVTPQNVAQTRSKIDPSAPKDQECPINGKKFTTAERDIWEKRRPLTVMIENHQDSRPQSGLSSADVVYEAVAEGGITRFMGVFYCGVASEEVQIGPVRSARTYFLDFASEYGDHPLYAHVGGANKPGPADALGQINTYGWFLYNDLNQFSIGFPTYWRDYERLGRTVATEHTMYSTTDKLLAVAAGRGLSTQDKNGTAWNKGYVPWKFTDGQPSTSAIVTKISFPFWGGYQDYNVGWTYDPATNTYKRESGGQPHLDMNNNQQLSTSNVVVQFTTLKGPIDELKHILYTTTGTGRALVFQNGNVTQATWSKKTRTDRTMFLDKTGKQITFVRGPIWIEVSDPTIKVTY
ncbi:MAG: DUF3048 domain-containing protein [Candidatus Blackburnbacteria bacterium]|nr:DUF3048 domain-containing protein [Candidatus Blackburnbacteria bacterium]